ncbi:MAG TPA: DUF6015 family protein [Thermoplasmata archaeon]|jgi:hypothetical protein
MITVKKLANAIEHRMHHDPEVAQEEARVVLGYFGFQDTIIDNRIDAEDRKLFYALSDAGLLQSYWETVPLLDGRNWRIFYWHLNTEAIEELERGAEPSTEDRVYQSLPEEAWSHPAAPG